MDPIERESELNVPIEEDFFFFPIIENCPTEQFLVMQNLLCRPSQVWVGRSTNLLVVATLQIKLLSFVMTWMPQ